MSTLLKLHWPIIVKSGLLPDLMKVKGVIDKKTKHLQEVNALKGKLAMLKIVNSASNVVDQSAAKGPLMEYRDDDREEDDDEMEEEDEKSSDDEEIEPVMKRPKKEVVIDDSLSEDEAMDDDDYSELANSEQLDKQEKLK